MHYPITFLPLFYPFSFTCLFSIHFFLTFPLFLFRFHFPLHYAIFPFTNFRSSVFNLFCSLLDRLLSAYYFFYKNYFLVISTFYILFFPFWFPIMSVFRCLIVFFSSVIPSSSFLDSIKFHTFSWLRNFIPLPKYFPDFLLRFLLTAFFSRFYQYFFLVFLDLFYFPVFMHCLVVLIK